MFFPPAVMISSFFRSTIETYPSSSIVPMSPEWSQPSSSRTSAVFSGSSRYPWKTWLPRQRISLSSSASRTSQPGMAGPTVPAFTWRAVQVIGPVFSDWP